MEDGSWKLEVLRINLSIPRTSNYVIIGKLYINQEIQENNFQN